MSKTLKDFLEVYQPKSPDEQKFVDKHVVIKHKDRNGNGDDVFNASNVKKSPRTKENHGYEPGDDEKVYEEVEGLNELSKGTLGRYAQKAISRLSDRRELEGYMSAMGRPHDKYAKSADKRERGLRMLSKKLTKEDVSEEGLMKTVAKKAGRAWNWSGSSIDQVRDDTDTLGPDSREWALKRKVNKHSPAELQQKMIKRDARNAARKTTNEEAGDDEHDHYLGKFEYQHRSGHYVKARVSKHPEGGYQVHWADGSKSRKNAAEMAKTIRSGGLIPEGVEQRSELMTLKSRIAANQKKMREIPGIHPDKKRLAVQIQKDTKRHKELFNKQMGKNEGVDLGEAVTVNKKNYSWGKMVTVHQGASTSYPLHPEHQEKIRKLSDGDKTTFKDETGATVHAHRSGDTVYLKNPRSSNRTTAVAHSHFTEEVDIDTVLDETLDLLMSIDEKTLTPAEMKKREEVVKAVKRSNPKMDRSMAYAIATKTAKRVAEEADLDEAVDPSKISGSRLANQLIGADDISKNKDGSHTIRRGFYYRSGTSEGHADKISKGLNELGIKHDIIDHGTHDFKRFKGGASVRTQNHHFVTVKIHPGQKIKLDESADLDESAKIAAHLIKRYGDNVRKSHVVSAANDFGVDASKLAKAVRTKLGKNMLDEENDDGWYTHNEMHGKVSKENWKKGWRYNHLKDKPFYHQPTKTWHASVKDIKEEVDELDELSMNTLKSYSHKANQDRTKAFGDAKRYNKRLAGADAAAKKIHSEALEPWMGKNVEVPAYLRKKDHEDNKRDALGGGKAVKNIKGVITREEIINRTVDKYVPEDMRYTPEERLLKRIDGLAEAHIDMILSLFEDLTYENQNKMIQSAETREGINQLLNFALENRGR
jgi:hypothetical protein